MTLNGFFRTLTAFNIHAERFFGKNVLTVIKRGFYMFGVKGR